MGDLQLKIPLPSEAQKAPSANPLFKRAGEGSLTTYGRSL